MVACVPSILTGWLCLLSFWWLAAHYLSSALIGWLYLSPYCWLAGPICPLFWLVDFTCPLIADWLALFVFCSDWLTLCVLASRAGWSWRRGWSASRSSGTWTRSTPTWRSPPHPRTPDMSPSNKVSMHEEIKTPVFPNPDPQGSAASLPLNLDPDPYQLPLGSGYFVRNCSSYFHMGIDPEFGSGFKFEAWFGSAKVAE